MSYEYYKHVPRATQFVYFGHVLSEGPNAAAAVAYLPVKLFLITKKHVPITDYPRQIYIL